jgi:hypothetical protein
MSVEMYIDMLERKLREDCGKQTHDRLEELLKNARRGVELRERYQPKAGRKFLVSR